MEGVEDVAGHGAILEAGTVPRYDPDMASVEYLPGVIAEFRKYRRLAEAALRQVPDDQLFATIGPESNSIAIVMKHIAGNMRSRWTGFLLSDGEKPDRERDSEFEIEAGEDAAAIRRKWDHGWELLFAALEPLTEADLSRTITIRDEPHTVMEAIQRQLTHYAYHIGQIVFLARHAAGGRWHSLSIPKGQSKTFDVSKSGTPYKV
jgi:uncharacterized damage-inducible protein DinB